MTLLVFIYVYCIDRNIEGLMPCLNKHNLHLKNILSSNNKFKEKSTFKSKKQSMIRCRCKYNALDNLTFSYLSLSCFLLMLLTEGFIFIFVSFITVVVNFQLKIHNVFLFYPEQLLAYRYTSSIHCIYVFTFNSDILSFGM